MKVAIAIVALCLIISFSVLIGGFAYYLFANFGWYGVFFIIVLYFAFFNGGDSDEVEQLQNIIL